MPWELGSLKLTYPVETWENTGPSSVSLSVHVKMPLPLAGPFPSLCLKVNLGFFQGLGEAHGGLTTPYGLSAILLFLAPLLLPLSDIPNATIS